MLDHFDQLQYTWLGPLDHMLAQVAHLLEIRLAGKKARRFEAHLTLVDKWTERESREVRDARELEAGILKLQAKGYMRDKDGMEALKDAREIIKNG